MKIGAIHSKAGHPASEEDLIDPVRLVRDYYDIVPDQSDARCRIRFGACGHRGSASKGEFNESHILAVVQSVCDFRRCRQIDGPLFLGRDTHALSEPAYHTTLDILAGNGLSVLSHPDGAIAPTPVISHAVLRHNRRHPEHRADALILTPSHNPPFDGGIKYNTQLGGPVSDRDVRWIQDRANEILDDANRQVRRKVPTPEMHQQYDFIHDYVLDLQQVIDMDLIAEASLRIGIDVMGGAAAETWNRINDVYDLEISILNDVADPVFSFIPLDFDGTIRMDCSSRFAVQGMVEQGKGFDVCGVNDPDGDRHGIVSEYGLMNPNDFLCVAAHYLFTFRKSWSPKLRIGKTVVSSAMFHRLAESLGRTIVETPVGFKWFVEGLFDEYLGIACEESAGTSFLRKDGRVWTTDKDGIIACLLAAEIRARTGTGPSEYCRMLTEQLGRTWYVRIDIPIRWEQKRSFIERTSDNVSIRMLADLLSCSIETRIPGTNEPFHGVKGTVDEGWFVVLPGGSENQLKIYAESFLNEDHMWEMVSRAGKLANELSPFM